jgi:hypothetical protein
MYFNVFSRLRESLQQFHNFIKFVVHCITVHCYKSKSNFGHNPRPKNVPVVLPDPLPVPVRNVPER